MRAIIGFVVLAAVAVAAAWWIAALPGDTAVDIGPYHVGASTPVMLTLLGILFVLLYLAVRLVATVLASPRVLRRRARDRARVRGDLAVNRALVALAANDAGAARREAERSRRLLGDTPLTLLLAAQAGRQAGREEEAAEVFKTLASRMDGRLLGLRGLLRQAMARQDWAEAARIAQQAEAAHPGAAWLLEERKRLALQTGQYREALRLLGSPRRGDTSTAEARAALGIAAADEESDPSASLRQAKAAFEAEPALGPAAVAYATRLRQGGRERSGVDVLRRCWSLLPQPDVAEAYLAPITDKAARYQAAAALVSANPRHPDSSLLLAHTALEAGQITDARRHAETARGAGLDDRRLWILLADLSEADGNHEGAQDALRRITTAGPGPSWRCLNCGTHHANWMAVCDACGVPGRVKWTAEAVHAPPVKAAAMGAIEGIG